ncbi:MAG: hypothetical protein ACHP8B_14705, partial [Terriglobales bacterium]
RRPPPGFELPAPAHCRSSCARRNHAPAQNPALARRAQRPTRQENEQLTRARLMMSFTHARVYS